MCGGESQPTNQKKTNNNKKKSSSFDIDLRIPAQAAIIKLQQVPEYREKEKHNWEKRTGKRLGTRQRLEELLEELYIFFSSYCTALGPLKGNNTNQSLNQFSGSSI